MDVRQMALESESVDVAIDKGMSDVSTYCTGRIIDLIEGTMDAMMTAKADVWVAQLTQPALSTLC